MIEKLKRALDAGEWIGADSELAPAYQTLLTECSLKNQRYNTTIMDADGMRSAMEDLTGQKMSPDCHFVTADHPRDVMEWRKHLTRGKPIRVGEDCWFGANVTVLPGVTIGDRCIIGAGSVVTKDIPSDTVSVGNPAHIVKKL